MNVLTLTARELGRLLRGRLTWLVLALTALSPAAGLTVLRFTASETMLSRCVAKITITGNRPLNLTVVVFNDHHVTWPRIRFHRFKRINNTEQSCATFNRPVR